MDANLTILGDRGELLYWKTGWWRHEFEKNTVILFKCLLFHILVFMLKWSFCFYSTNLALRYLHLTNYLLPFNLQSHIISQFFITILMWQTMSDCLLLIHESTFFFSPHTLPRLWQRNYKTNYSTRF